MPFRLGGPELIIVLVIIMIVFGVGKLPQVGGAMGKGIRQFRRGVSGEDEETAGADAGDGKGVHRSNET